MNRTRFYADLTMVLLSALQACGSTAAGTEASDANTSETADAGFGTYDDASMGTTADAGHDDGAKADGAAPGKPETDGPWKFVMVADTHVTASGAPLPELMSAIANEEPSLVLVAGDIVQTGKGTSPDEMMAELSMFDQFIAPLKTRGIPVYPVRGNHEADATASAAVWKEWFSEFYPLPGNGPVGEQGLSYSVTFKNALFVAVDEYVSIHRANQSWLDALLTTHKEPHVFVFGHEPAFKLFHGDCMDDDVAARNDFWRSLTTAGAKVYLAGHDHFRDLSRIDDGDQDPSDDLYQYIGGTGGGPFPPAAGAPNGDNEPYTPVSISHDVQNGYLLVEVSGEGGTDREVTMTFKQRSCDTLGVSCSYDPALDVFSYTAPAR